MLFNRTKWLDENITEDKHPGLRKYLMEKLDIAEIDPERFAREFTKEFIEKQSDEWVKRFYVFLVKQEALWKKKTYSREKEGILRSKPIIRLENDSHTIPFDYQGKPRAYLPHTNRSINKFFQNVKESIVHDPEAKEFLQSLGIREPDNIAAINDHILPLYKGDAITTTDKVNKTHVEWISKTLESETPSDTRRELLWKLKETPFLWANNIASSHSGYKKPADVHLGEIYTGNRDLGIYFEGNDGTWFLDERYLNVIEVSALEEVGCKNKVQVNHKGCSWQVEPVKLVDGWGAHKRGLDGFDPDCEIEGLEYALEHINFDRAKIIWDILEKHYKRIYGTVEISKNKNFIGSEKKAKFSKMGELLSGNSWVPDIEGKFHEPSEILLSELPEEFDKESLKAKSIAEKLQFKTDAEQQLIKLLPEGKKNLYEKIKDLSEENQKKAFDLIESLGAGGEITGEVSIQEIKEQVEEALTSPTPRGNDSSDKPIKFSGLTPEEEEQIREEYGENLLKRIKKRQSIETKIIKERRITDSIDSKEFLLAEYDGHCQICNTCLDLGHDKKPYFEIFRLVEIRGKNIWSNMEFNVLCLCPNCHALLKHGGRDLSNVLEVANKLSKDEIAPEPVDERRGDFYIVKVGVAGKEKELFYSPTHINKFAAFIEQSTDNAKKEE